MKEKLQDEINTKTRQNRNDSLYGVSSHALKFEIEVNLEKISLQTCDHPIPLFIFLHAACSSTSRKSVLHCGADESQQ